MSEILAFHCSWKWTGNKHWAPPSHQVPLLWAAGEGPLQAINTHSASSANGEEIFLGFSSSVQKKAELLSETSSWMLGVWDMEKTLLRLSFFQKVSKCRAFPARGFKRHKLMLQTVPARPIQPVKIGGTWSLCGITSEIGCNFWEASLRNWMQSVGLKMVSGRALCVWGVENDIFSFCFGFGFYFHSKDARKIIIFSRVSGDEFNVYCVWNVFSK